MPHRTAWKEITYFLRLSSVYARIDPTADATLPRNALPMQANCQHLASQAGMGCFQWLLFKQEEREERHRQRGGYGKEDKSKG
jgi:hypothetical protein